MVYDWAAVEMLPLPPHRAIGHWLLASPHAWPTQVKPAYYVCSRLAETPLEELVRVAVIRRAGEECFEEAKGEVGLDPYEVRRSDGRIPAHHSSDVRPSLSDGNQASGEGTWRKAGHCGPVHELIRRDGPGGAGPAAHVSLRMDGKPTSSVSSCTGRGSAVATRPEPNNAHYKRRLSNLRL